MSLALDSSLEFDGGAPSQDLPLTSLVLSRGVRSGGLDEPHVALLMETVEQWPPIIVWSENYLVIDGTHRVEAARRLGCSRIAAVRFLGTRDEAFVESIRRNVDHGLPLSVGDRRRAASHVLRRHPEWSDRRIASLCGLSGKTLARLRRDELAGSKVEGVIVGLERRVGRDGKARPVQAGEVRDRIRQALEQNPAGSLRVIAAMAGASPETVRTVKTRLAVSGDHDSTVYRLPTPSSPCGSRSSALDVLAESISDDSPLMASEGRSDGRDPSWTTDAALLACADGGEFARWFDSNKIDGEWHRHVWSIPMGRVYEVVDEARRRAATWTTFASILESRTR